MWGKNSFVKNHSFEIAFNQTALNTFFSLIIKMIAI